MTMDVNDLRIAVTVLSLVLFSGLMAYTWWPKRRGAYADAARLPFDGEVPANDEGARS
jgi:cytochrome c oxidase cbb3-type subunit 4